MRAEDLREIGRRLDEVEEIFAHGYEPIHDGDGAEALWEKCHCGSVHTHEGALLDIEKYRRSVERDR